MLARVRWWTCAVIAAIPAFSACGPGSFESNIDQLSLTVRDSVFFSWGSPGQEGLYLFMSDQPDLCESLQANSLQKEATYFFVQFSGGPAPQTGDFQVNPTELTGKLANAGFVKVDATCSSEGTISASSGSVKLDSYEAKPSGWMDGSFALDFSAEGAKAKGWFHARNCALDSSAFESPMGCR